MNSSHKQIDSLLRQQPFSGSDNDTDVVCRYAEGVAAIEKCIVVVSDLRYATSRIFHSEFSGVLGLRGLTAEDSIWESELLGHMSAEEREEKYLAELRFYNLLRHMPCGRRDKLYLATHLRMTDRLGRLTDVLHRMYYVYEGESDAIRFGVCIYGPMVFGLPSKSVAIDSTTGQWEELTSKTDGSILSVREKQVLTLIEQGLTSRDIADRLCISRNTVSRHRQEILARLQVKNSTEACRRAKQLGLI